MKRNTYIHRARPSSPRGMRWKRIFLVIALLLVLPKLTMLAMSYMTGTNAPVVSSALDLQRIQLVAMERSPSSRTEQSPRSASESVETVSPDSDILASEEETVLDETSSVLEKIVQVARGDTLMGILLDAGLARSEAHAAVSALQEVYNPRSLRPGHEVVLTFVPGSEQEEDGFFAGLRMQVDVDRNVLVLREGEEDFAAKEEQWELQVVPHVAHGEITSSLYTAAARSGMPSSVLIQMIRALSFDVDFQRDIQPGDRFEAMFERELDDQGQAVREGALLYANLETSGRTLQIFRYTALDGETDYFNARGQSVRRTLMLTPIDGARISSGYGMRRHPILGYSRMHPGLDFAAPTGTPIMAAGNGVVTHAGRKGNYGITVELRHPNEYTTLYAHMSRLGRGISRGARVTQGQVIGYVGSTGMSTGPHLHYEVHLRGQHVNPASVNSPPGRTLTGEDLNLFKAMTKQMQAQYASLAGRVVAETIPVDASNHEE
ncbi:M23 family metallopeptidase [Desulfonatronum thioautotrophicum]|uniref:M23 family metallopeptidase n=1 Tax=Desulfonatronum thioautotrophicum TaxID=617001 RepID=UPI00069BEF5E|nr:M23 family metallopeptidase [Desulfonatronum thioautotrophicum]